MTKKKRTRKKIIQGYYFFTTHAPAPTADLYLHALLSWSGRKDAKEGTEKRECNGSTKRGADGRTYSEHSRSPSYSRIELGLRTKYCAFWSGGQVAQW